MSEQEKQASGGKEGSAIVMVEQTASHVKPYRPTDMQQDSDVHHKRSRAPAVPSVAEELKNLAEEGVTNQDVQSTELKESERATSSDHKHSVSKKNSKRRDSSPDIPQLRPIGIDPTKDSAATKAMQKTNPSPTQPIPPQIQEEKSEPSVLQLKADAEAKEDDSIMEEITELQTPEEAKKHSEWSDDEEAGGLPRSESRASRVSRAVRQLFCCGVRYEAASEDNISTRSVLPELKWSQVNSQPMKKQSVSWNDAEYQRTIVLQDLGTKSQDWFLEKKASVGPCFRPGMPFEGPSGIMICVPKKSMRCVSVTSGININISRRSLAPKEETNQDKRYKLTTPDDKMDCEIAYAKFYKTLKEKVNTMRNKIKCAFNM